MSHRRLPNAHQAIAAASVAAVVLVMLAPLRPGAPLHGGGREASAIPLLAADGLADSRAFHRLEFEPRVGAGLTPEFRAPLDGVSGRRPMRSVTVRKKVLALPGEITAPRKAWAYLSRTMRDQIDAGAVSRGGSSCIVLHGSGGMAAPSLGAMSRMHRRILGLGDGVAYDFIVAGDGDGAGIMTGDRWREGTSADGEVRICVRGDFQTSGPGPAQLAALDELIDYLRVAIGHLRVTTHAREAGRTVGCMGEAFPEAAVLEALNPQP